MKGKKTYICAGIMGLVAVAYGMGMIDESTRDLLEGLVLGGGLAALRAGIS